MSDPPRPCPATLRTTLNRWSGVRAMPPGSNGRSKDGLFPILTATTWCRHPSTGRPGHSAVPRRHQSSSEPTETTSPTRCCGRLAARDAPGAGESGERRNPAVHDALQQQPAQIPLGGLHRVATGCDPFAVPGRHPVRSSHRWGFRGHRIAVAARAVRTRGPFPRAGCLSAGLGGRSPGRRHLPRHDRRRRVAATDRRRGAQRHGAAGHHAAGAAARPVPDRVKIAMVA